MEERVPACVLVAESTAIKDIVGTFIHLSLQVRLWNGALNEHTLLR